jgi:protein-S-isoprenylcysteine O-methyltransferase Ste14
MSDLVRGRIYVGVQFALIIAAVIQDAQADAWGSWHTPVVGLGVVLVVIGFAIEFASARALGASLTANPVPKETGTLVRSGIYKYMRHPIYTGLMFFAVGLVLQKGLVPDVYFALALIVLLNFKARWEERLLLQRYPEYLEYMSSTPRFLPRLKG